MRSLFLLLGLLCLLTLKSFAQPSVPVDLVTGQALVSVPLGEVSYGDLSIPIVLSYDATGVKPQGGEGNAGMNWNLVAGGQILRELRGLPDDYNGTDGRKGWLINYAPQVHGFSSSSDDNLMDCSDEEYDWTFIHDLMYRDSEPDIFSFSAPGLSGQFVFGPDKLPKLMPYQDLKVEFDPAALEGTINTISITKNDGTRYTFSAKESVTRDANGFYGTVPSQFLTEWEQYRTPLKFNTVWSLTEIRSAGGAVIMLCYGDNCNEPNEYDNRDRIVGVKKTVEICDVNSTATSTPSSQYYVQDIITTRSLAWISSPAKKVEFIYTYDGLLEQVEFTTGGTDHTKNYRLQYIETRNVAEQSGKMFLKQVIETNSMCESFPAYQFDYYDVTYGSLTATTALFFNIPNTKQDYWGYFNDWAESKNPTIYYYAGKTGAERYRFYPIPGLTETSKINGANRNVNPTKVIYGSLKTVTYPTSGSATIVYEPNQWFDAEANTTQYGPGLRVKQVTIQDNVVAGSEDIVLDYEYKMADDKSSGKWTYRSVFGYHDVNKFYATVDDQSPEARILYQRVKVKRSGRGEVVYDYLLPGMYPLTSDSDWSATQTNFARSTSCAGYGEIKKQYFSHPFSRNTNYDFERGLLWRVTDFDSSLKKIQETEYGYQRLGTPAVLVNGLHYELLNGTTNLATGANAGANIYVFGKYSLLANVGKVMLSETVRVPDMADSTKKLVTSTSYTYSSVHHMLSSMESVNSDGFTYRTKYKYAKDFASLTQPDAADAKSVMLKKLNDDFRHGANIETISSVVKSGVETITGASLVLYNDFPDSLGAARPLPSEVRTYAGTSGHAEAVVSPASGSNQVLSFNASVYQPRSFVDQYDFIGNPVTIRDNQRKLQSFHLGYKSSLPVAQFDNATESQVLYDGFETYTGGGFDITTGGVTYPAGWSGYKAAQISASDHLERTSIAKGQGDYYRYSCWVYATAARDVTFTILDGMSVVSSGTISYTSSDVNNWKYFEGRISVAAAPETFKLRLEANGTTDLDEIAFYPETGSVSFFGYDPLFGKTSEMNGRGVGVFYEYDALGRLKFVKDQEKNLRQTVDYYYTVQPYPVVTASFSADFQPYQVVKNVTVNYAANTSVNCALSPLTYDWYVNDVKLGDNVTTFQYTFSLEQQYVVRLVVTHPSLGAVANSVTYDVKKIGSGPITPTISTEQGTGYTNCDFNHTKTFDLELSGCYVLEDVEIAWYYNLNNAGWLLLTNDDNEFGVVSNYGQTMEFDPVVAFNGLSNIAAYQIKCEVTTTCPVTGVTTTSSFTQPIGYEYLEHCP
jgi:hypothetical protein